MFRASLMVLVTAGTFGSAAAPPAAAAAKAIRDKLAQPVTLDMGFQNGTPLREALELISDRYDVTILVDTQAFKLEGRMEPVDAVQLPKIVGIKLSTVLRLLLEQVDATYLIRDDHIEVTTFQRARPDFGTAGSLALTVNAEFDKIPLDEALQQLSDLSGISVVVDGRVRDHAKTDVTATLNNVPIGTAVLILADMADLRPVALDNVLYVTTEENAKFLRNSSKRTENQESEWPVRP